jgi:hypothetical protein
MSPGWLAASAIAVSVAGDIDSDPGAEQPARRASPQTATTASSRRCIDENQRTSDEYFVFARRIGRGYPAPG